MVEKLNNGLSFFEGVTEAVEIVTGMNEQLMGECPICMENFCSDAADGDGSGGKLFRMKRCFHAMHRECVVQYWRSFKKQKDA